MIYPKIFVLKKYQSYKNTNAQDIGNKTVTHFLQMLWHTCCSLTMLSRVTFVIVPSWPEVVNSLPNILHFLLITGRKVDQTSFITIKSVIYYISLFCHSTCKSWCLINIYADLTAFPITLKGSYSSFGRIKFSSY